MNVASRIYGYAVCFLCILIAFSSLALLASTAKGWRQVAKRSVPTDTIATDTMSTDTSLDSLETFSSRLASIRAAALQEEKRAYEEARLKLLHEADLVEVAAYAAIFLLALITFAFHWRWLQRVGI